MKFEVLKRSHLKRNIIIGLFAVAIISATVLNFTQAKYRVTESIPLINGTIHYTPYDLNLVAMYQQDETGEYISIDTVPTSGYTLNESESYCEINDTKDNTITIEYQDGKVNFLGLMKKGTKCYLYFDEYVPTALDTILAGKDIQERTSFNSALTTNTNGIIYQEDTSDGTTYYFAGNTTENWVSFAGYYWRIIRVNEDGSIRMIYNGTSTSTTGSGTQLQTSTFSIDSSTYNNNAYVGYMYTRNNVHGTGTDSGIKKIVDNFYRDHIAGEYEDYISKEAGFCGDRTPSTSNSSINNSGGTGTTVTYYAPSIRLYGSSNKQPTFECSNDSDLYTVKESSKGNHALTYPIGLITADEVAYAGGLGSSNSSYYLYTHQTYWTMSPYYFGSDAHVFFVASNGVLLWGDVNDSYGVRPVLNLDAGVTLTGSGTTSDPYEVSLTN